MPGTCLVWQRAWRMHEVFGVGARTQLGTLGEAHCITGRQLLTSNFKLHNLPQLESWFGNLFACKTWPYLIWQQH